MVNPDYYQPKGGDTIIKREPQASIEPTETTFAKQERNRNKGNSNGGLVLSFVIVCLTVSDQIWEVCLLTC